MNPAIRIINISHKLRSLESHFFSNHRLMKYEFNTLAIISNVLSKKENVCAKDIAKINGMSLSAVSRLLNNMEQKGLITRNVDKTDRRNVIVHISDEGKRISDEFVKNMDSFFERIFGQLSETERPLYNEITEKLLDATDSVLTNALKQITEASNV